MRKSISLIFELSKKYEIPSWRQAKKNISTIKKLMRSAQNRKKSRSKDEEIREKQEKLCQEAHQKLIDISAGMLIKIQETLGTLRALEDFSFTDEILAVEIEKFVKHGERQIDQIRRRVIEGETIPHDEKVLSIFEPHTECISKGKAGVPDLGNIIMAQRQKEAFKKQRVLERKRLKNLKPPPLQKAA